MIVFRWIIGSVAGLLVFSIVLSYVLGMAFSSDIWMRRGTRLRQYVWIFALVWFNTEVWGRVVWTMFHWNR